MLKRMKYRLIESGVRGVVQLLVKHGFYPVWSCEGHPDSARPKWVMFGTSTDPTVLPYTVRWDRPVVICAGNYAEASRTCLFLDERIDGAYEADMVRMGRGAPLTAMRHAAPGKHEWFLLSFPGVDRQGRVKLLKAGRK